MTATGLQQNKVDCLHGVTVRGAINAPVNAATRYFRSESTSSEHKPLFILGEQRSVDAYSLEKGVVSAHSSRNHETASHYVAE